MVARILATLVLLLLPVAAMAQVSWKLTNISNQTLNFDTFDAARGTWKAQTVYPNQPISYAMSGGEAKFRIATQNRGFVEYKVRADQAYTLGWDKAKGVWDLKFAKASPVANPVPAAATVASYELRNSSNQTLPFETFDPARGTWKAQSAYPNQVKNMTFTSGARNGKIRVATEGRGHVEYDVHAGWKYNLLWDATKGVWDFRTISRGV